MGNPQEWERYLGEEVCHTISGTYGRVELQNHSVGAEKLDRGWCRQRRKDLGCFGSPGGASGVFRPVVLKLEYRLQ